MFTAKFTYTANSYDNTLVVSRCYMKWLIYDANLIDMFF
jgi:hypothetical protein